MKKHPNELIGTPLWCSICRAPIPKGYEPSCTSNHERVPWYLRSERVGEVQRESREAVDKAIRHATEKARGNAAA